MVNDPVAVGYLAAVGAASVVLVGLSVLLDFVLPKAAFFTGGTPAAGFGLVVFAATLSVYVAVFMTIMLILPFCLIYWFARASGIQDRLFYIFAGVITGLVFGAMFPHGLFAAPIAGGVGGLTFWHIAVRNRDIT